MKTLKAILKRAIPFALALCMLAVLASCSGALKSGTDKAPGGMSYSGRSSSGRKTDGGVHYDVEGVADAAAARDGAGYYEEAAEGLPPTEAGVDEDAAGEAEEKLIDENKVLMAGQITAGAQDDNRYYAQWLKLFAEGDGQTEAGKFLSYKSANWGMNSQRRIVLTVTCQDAPVANAQVVCRDADQTAVFSAVTNASGVAYLFPGTGAGTVTVTSGSGTASVAYTAEDDTLAVALETSAAKGDVIDLMFVVDVTGSMGDEIRYLQAEMRDVIQQVSAANANATVNLAFLFYRDKDDRVPFKYVNFSDVTNEKNLKKQLEELDKQSADGGGDYEEAVDEALEMAMSKNWSPNSTKLLFLVLDAPAHNGQIYQTRFANAVRSAEEQGIRICPILASGADMDCEYTTRSAAIMTGGTFVFITNDSGIGGDHYDPDLPNVTIEYLNACLIRLINGYHTGTFADPVAWNAKTPTAEQQ